MLYEAQHFIVQELVSPEVYERWGVASWWFVDVRLVITLDQMRDEFGPITVNDWVWGGKFKYSGLRPLTGGVGSEWSQHRFGRGADSKPKNVTPQEMYARILAKPEKFPYLRCMEHIDATPTWVHTDVRNHDRPGILIVNP